MEYWNGGLVDWKDNIHLKKDFLPFCTHYSIIPLFHHSDCDLPARALQWQAGRSELT